MKFPGIVRIRLLALIPLCWASLGNCETGGNDIWTDFAKRQLDVDLSFVFGEFGFRHHLVDTLGPPDSVTVDRVYVDNDPTYKPVIDTWTYDDQLEIQFTSNCGGHWLSTKILKKGKYKPAGGVDVGMTRERVISQLQLPNWAAEANPVGISRRVETLKGHTNVVFSISFDEDDLVKTISWGYSID